MSQTRKQSVAEAVWNIVIGFAYNWCLNLLILPLVGMKEVTPRKAGIAGLFFTVGSLVRQYLIRRWRVRKGE